MFRWLLKRLDPVSHRLAVGRLHWVLIPGPVYRQDIDSRINCCLSDKQDLGSVETLIKDLYRMLFSFDRYKFFVFNIMGQYFIRSADPWSLDRLRVKALPRTRRVLRDLGSVAIKEAWIRSRCFRTAEPRQG